MTKIYVTLNPDQSVTVRRQVMTPTGIRALIVTEQKGSESEPSADTAARAMRQLRSNSEKEAYGVASEPGSVK